MKKPIHYAVTALSIAAIWTSVARAEEPPRKMNVFYFGNSLVGSARPDLHEKLGASAGKEWKTDVFAGAGWQPWQHRNELWRAMGKPVDAETQSASSRGDLTLDEELAKAAPGKPRKFFNGEWDAILIQIFGSHLNRMTDGMWGGKFDGMVDVGDVGASCDIIRIFLDKNPEGKVFIYTVWPNMQANKKLPPEDTWPDWAHEMKKRTGKNPRTAEFPDRENFDYAAQWEKPYEGDFDRPWIGNICRTRDFTSQVFEGIRKEFPELWAQGRLIRVPMGELCYELEKKMKAGEFPGHTTVLDFYTDVQHFRAGMASYAITALFYAAIFGEKPDALDYTIYTDPANQKPEDPSHDAGDPIPISPEQAKVLHETIWEVLNSHPHVWGERPKK